MDKIQKAVYDRVKQHCEYAKSARCLPVQITHGELLRFMEAGKEGRYTTRQINRALSGLFGEGRILAGPTVHDTYITLPEYYGK